jgi:hypothetical protein
MRLLRRIMCRVIVTMRQPFTDNDPAQRERAIGLRCSPALRGVQALIAKFQSELHCDETPWRADS